MGADVVTEPEAGTRIRVLIADDEAQIRAALADLLGTEPTLEVVGMAGDTAEAVALCERQRPDVVLMDVKMPGSGGAAATRTICRFLPGVRVLALSAYEDRATVLEMLEAGAQGYLTKGTRAVDLITAIHRLVDGQDVLSPDPSGRRAGGNDRPDPGSVECAKP